MSVQDLPASSFRTPSNDDPLTVTLTPKGADKYTLKCEVGTAVGADTDLTVKFTAGESAIDMSESHAYQSRVWSPHLLDSTSHYKQITILNGATSGEADIDIVAAAAANSLVAGTEYTISCTGYTPSQTKFTPVFNYPALTVTLKAISKTKYSLKCEVAENVVAETTIPIKFTAGDKTIAPEVKIAAAAKSAEVELEVVTTAADGKFLAGTEYTIACDGYTPSVTTFKPLDNSILTGSTKLAPPAEGKKADGAVDKVTLTLVNALLPATLPEGAKNTLKLAAEAPAKSNTDYTLDKGEKFVWTPADGSLAVEYLFNDCKIAKDSTVKATLVITDDLTFTEQAITYAEGAKSVASVVTALFAVLALVF
ncbi:hypothetical protein BLNAU_14714 [Blattamonas nauphoetae]|uniref:Ig-like domain-containing protein n=1 Tax=Blattamonas nauphoetae TaxID=2049346 RepID=A0ABQ9XHR0_9EUKA|nr:hypothetical protein BLNAU_14714 [Blattamonas nauphoetae]